MSKAAKKKGPSEDKSTKPEENKDNGKKNGNKKKKPALSPSEALYGFVGWLSARPRKTVLAYNRNAAVACELVDEFCKANKLKAPSKDWNKKLVTPGS